MSRPSFPSPWNLLRCCAVVLVCTVPLATAPTARAGLGNLVKKAKDKVAGKEQAAVGDNKVEFDEVVVELTDERLERIIATFKAASAASAGRPALVEKLNKTTEERQKHLDKHGEAIQEVQRKRGDVEVCLHDGYQEVRQQRTQEYQEKALTDPTIREKFTRIAQEHNAPAARGDSVAIQKAQEAILSVVLPTHEDSLEVQKKCGPVPPPLPSEGKLADLDKQIASLNEQIRSIDKKVAAAQAEAGGMDQEQFAMAMERIQMYLSWRQSKSYSKSATRGFTQEEIDALEKYLEKLRAALG